MIMKLSIVNHVSPSRGGTRYKRPYVNVLPTWVAKASWCMNDPLQNAESGIWMGWFFKIKFWAQIDSNLRKFWKNQTSLLKIWPEIGRLVYMSGSLFLEKLSFEWTYFQISWLHLPNKTKLEYPLPDHVACAENVGGFGPKKKIYLPQHKVFFIQSTTCNLNINFVFYLPI